MKRIEALKQLCTEFNGGKLARSLTEGEFEELIAFIEDNDDRDFLKFEQTVNRWHLDKKKPKNLFKMQELALSANFRAHQKDRK